MWLAAWGREADATFRPDCIPMNSPDIHEAAAAWVVAHDRGLTAAEQDAFSEWLAADPRHGRAFLEQKQAWNSFDLLQEWRPRHSHEPNPDILEEVPLNRTKRKRTWLAGMSALAACFVLVAWVAFSRFASEPAYEMKVAGTSSLATFVVSADDARFVTLPDNSEIDLNEGAELRVEYTAARRQIEVLRGEAFFTVRKDATRAFDVVVGRTKVRAVGTRFGVKFERDEVAVVVEEGQVLFGTAEAIELAARGEGGSRVVNLRPRDFTSLSLEHSERLPVVRTLPVAETEALLRWKPEVLEFASQPLAEVVEQFNQRNSLKIVLADESLRAIPIVASFRSNNVLGFVKLLEVTGVAQVRQYHGSTVELSAP